MNKWEIKAVLFYSWIPYIIVKWKKKIDYYHKKKSTVKNCYRQVALKNPKISG